MTPQAAATARARGVAIRSARRQRVWMLRRRVISGALALFVAIWVLITLILITGHDPALARQRTTTSAATNSNTTTTANVDAGTSSSSGSTGSSSTSAVTSRQS